MDNLLITDSREVFNSSVQTNKILFGYHIPGVILASSNLDANQIAMFNDDFLVKFLKHGNRIIKKIEELCSEVEDVQSKLNQISTNEWLKGLCHSLYEEHLERYFLIEDLLKHFGENFQCELKLSNPNIFSSNGSGRMPKQLLRQKVKNKLYVLFDIKNLFQRKQSFDFVYLLTNAPHHFELLSQVFIKHELNGDSVAVVIYPTRLGNTHKSLKHLPESVPHFDLPQFRSLPKISLSRRPWKFNSLLNFDSVELSYTMMLNILFKLSPKVCITMGYQNHTRFLAQSCAHNGIKSVSIDYSMITDDYRFERSIRFDHKITISNSQANLWKKRNDPSLNHHTIGYLKYDNFSKDSFNRIQFQKEAEFEFEQTVMFASSYGFDDKIKSDLISYLSDFCFENHYNLLIKKHPLETDMIADEAVSANSYKSQAVFSHEEISALEAVNYSDLVISQGSSIVLDALFLSKPFITYSTGENSITDLMPLSKEKFLLKASSLEELGEKIMLGMKGGRNDILNEMMGKRPFYLGGFDGDASDRLLAILREINKEK